MPLFRFCSSDAAKLFSYDKQSKVALTSLISELKSILMSFAEILASNTSNLDSKSLYSGE